MKTEEFKPTFREDVFVTGPWGAPAQVNPLYCATEQCAVDLASVLEDLKPTITHMTPFGPTFDGNVPFVPWLVFVDGSMSQAGLLAAYWTHGWTPEIAERNCRLDITTNMAYYATQKQA